MKFKNNRKFGIVIASVVFAFILQFLVIPVAGVAKNVYASTATQISVTNGNFNSNSTAYYLEGSPSGWSKVYTTSSTTAGIINTRTPNFTSYQDSYNLSVNPQTMYVDTTDTKVLMINARNNNSNEGSYYQGFNSNSISLAANSYYMASILVKTEVGAMASIYVNNLQDDNLDSSLTQFELIQTSLWKEYKFYIETGSETQSISFGLWLGSKNSVKSPFAVFFDNVSLYQLNQKRFVQEQTNNSTTKSIELSNQFVASVVNSNFETVSPLGWTPVDAFPINSIHQVVNTTQPQLMTTQGYTYLGSDGLSGSNALWLASKGTHSEFGYKSSDITINRFGIYKININVKVDSDTIAKVALVENDDINEFYANAGIDEQYYSYEPSSTQFSITSNATNVLLNNYNTYSFYVKGHSLFDTTVHIELMLVKASDSEEQVKGSALFDNVTVERISSTKFVSASDSSTVKKMELSTITGTPSFTNGTFNAADTIKSGDVFPISPSNWTSNIKDESENIYGIINTNTAHYNANKANYGNVTNPGNPVGFLQDTDVETNNVLMLWNKTSSYQSVTSSEFNVSADSYYTLSFYYKVLQTANYNFNVKVINVDGNKLFEQNEIGKNSNATWTKFTTTIKVGSVASNLKLVLSLGTENQMADGFAFVDNVTFNTTTLTDETFTQKVNLQNSNNKVIDLSNLLLNTRLAEKDEFGVYELSAFAGKLEQGTQNPNSDAVAEAGVLDGNSNEYGILASEQNLNAVKNVFFIRNNATANYSITSISKTSLSANTVYKFSIYLRTRLQTPADENYNQSYGATFSLVGTSESISNIKTNDEWKEYIIIVNTTDAVDIQLKFALDTQTETSGLLFVDNFTMSTLTNEEYQTYVNTFESEESDNLLIIGSTDIEEEVEDDAEEVTPAQFNWLILPSALTAIALILAVSGSVLKRVNFKKFIKRRTSEYDRKKTLYRDVIRKEAEAKRDAEIKQYNEDIKIIEEKLLTLEAENKERLANNRRVKGKAIDKSIEKEFKLYASKHTHLENQKDALIEKIKNANSAEYLLNLQKKITAENLKKELSKPKQTK